MIIQAVQMEGSEPRPAVPVKGRAAKETAPPARLLRAGPGTWAHYLANARPDLHDRSIANILAVASGWAYSDIDTFARLMARRFLPGHEAVGFTNTNPVLFVDTTAYLIQSADRRVAILAFRGTGLQNTTNWLTDASARQEVFPVAGHVHGGFFRATLVLLYVLERVLGSALRGDPICDAAVREQAVVRDCIKEAWWQGALSRVGAGERERPEPLHHNNARPEPGNENELEALYITGHSLGGALAVIMAALVQVLPQFDALRKKLRGVYTYGQPMVGDQDFADRFEELFGKQLFRHVYHKDIVPRLPPITTGAYRHFGAEYAAGDIGWEYRSKSVSQTLTFLGSTAFSLFTTTQKLFAGIPILRWLPALPNWIDHEPINYLRTSQSISPGSELV